MSVPDPVLASIQRDISAVESRLNVKMEILVEKINKLEQENKQLKLALERTKRDLQIVSYWTL